MYVYKIRLYKYTYTFYLKTFFLNILCHVRRKETCNESKKERMEKKVEKNHL